MYGHSKELKKSIIQLSSEHKYDTYNMLNTYNTISMICTNESDSKVKQKTMQREREALLN